MIRLRSGLLFLTLLGLFLLAIGCGSSSPPGGGGCTGCSGCCQNGTCQPGTSVNACGTGGAACTTCSSGGSCTLGACQNVVVPQVGDKCVANADCGAAGLCAADVPGGGYCTQDCTTTACPSGASCVALSATQKLCLRACQGTSGCRTEQLCQSNLCLPKCTADSDCASSNCDVSSGLCGASRVGRTCSADADCGQAPAFCDTSAAGGYCSLPCGGPTNSTCPAGSNCTSAGVCLLACQDASGCRTGSLCMADGTGAKSCTPACQSNADCGAGLRCDTGSGACVQTGPSAGAIGAGCVQATDCTATPGTPFCGNFPGGYCSADCSANPSLCGAGGTCVDLGGGNVDCLGTCGSAVDCRAGYRCVSAGTANVCVPKCQSANDCGGATPVCDQTSGNCVSGTTSTTSVETVDLTAGGPVTVFTDHLGTPVTATVPADAVSVTFVGQAADTTARIVVYRIESPDGRIYDYASTSSRMKILPPTGPGSFSVLAPNSPTAPFSPGTWTLYLLGAKQTTATVKALIKHAPSPALSAGSVDMNLFFVGLTGLNATSAPTDANFQTILTRLRSVWANAGMSVGTVKYIDITGANATRFQDLKESDLGALMQLSADPQANDNALNVFFVRTISGGTLDGYIILGESAGIPGVPVRGTTGSGMAVTTADFPQGLNEIADTWVHEGSHWLGLFHTTESAGTAFDPLPDTPECPAASRDANHDNILQPTECVGFGADDVMFWTSIASIPNTVLTPNQSYVLLRNPAVH